MRKFSRMPAPINVLSLPIIHNHPDFSRLHRQGQPHEGIISCTQDPQNHAGLAQRIHDAIMAAPNLANQFIRIIRPNPSANP
jgi:hypothetical protein